MKLIINTMKFVPDSYNPSPSEIVVNTINGLKIENYTTAIIANLIERDIGLKEAQKYRIKQLAKERIESLSWRMERAQEREKIGANGETIEDVCIEKEAIRVASNRIESVIDSLNDEEHIRSQVLNIIEDDYPVNNVLTKLEFMRKFTSTERVTIRNAISSGSYPILEDWWDLLQLASFIDIKDTDTISALTMLEQNGFLDTGRANEILTL